MPKQVSPALQIYLNTVSDFQMADIYLFTLADGTAYYRTSNDVAITYQNNLYTTDWQLSRSNTSVRVGLEVDDMTITIKVGDGGPTVNGIPIQLAIQNGLFDGAQVLVGRFYYGPNEPVWLFSGNISDIDLSHTSIEITVKSYLDLLGDRKKLPLYQFTPQCVNIPYSVGCGLNRAALTASGTLTSTGTLTQIATSLTAAEGYFSGGVFSMTSGPCAGARRTVKSYVDGSLSFAQPLPTTPQAGDTFTIYPTCPRTRAACKAFNNDDHFRGYLYTPQPEAVL